LAALLEQEALTPQQRAEAGDALGKLGDLRPGVCSLEPDLVEIPAGEFLYGEKKERRKLQQPFAIARYPVTVAQFGMFMAAGGYEEPRYWGGEESAGWRWRMSEHDPGWRGEGPVTQPEYWLQTEWHGDNRPIIGISWYEAQAYCVWLTEQSGREYRLPAEEEWERAARHTDGREWAWGTEWENGIINSQEAGVRRTTAVGSFPRSAAACGAQDMSGNVWEWTASFYDDSKNRYCVRGGSWYLNRVGARVAGRSWYYPGDSDDYFGFRVVSPVF
jgi:formylglycine-generating enzyme required for sulfatase activity